MGRTTIHGLIAPGEIGVILVSYQSINSREIIVPELGITLHLHSIELPASIAEVADGKNPDEVDKRVAFQCQEILRLGPSQVVSFTDWARTTNQVGKLLDIYQPQYLNDSQFQAARRKVETTAKGLTQAGNYLDSLIMNGLLVPRQQRVPDSDLTWFDRAATDEHFAPQFFGNLATGGVSELGFANWYQINQLLHYQPYPSSAVAREEVPKFEIPFAGSKPIKAITIESFQKLCYGAAALVMSETALMAASALGRGQPPALVAVLGGSISALVFVSVGSLSRYLEEFLKSRSTLSAAPQSTKTRKARAA
jgi:hypothetical protein